MSANSQHRMHDLPSSRHSVQLRALSELGEHAVRTDDPDMLLDRAARCVAAGIGAEHALVLERQPGAFLIRAGVGWDAALAGRRMADVTAESPAGLALRSRAAVACEDLRSDTRFDIPDLLAEHGVRATLDAVIGGEDAPFGVLEIGSTWPRRFDGDDAAFVQACANLIAAAVGRGLRRQTVAAGPVRPAHDNDILMGEFQHRVKNNLQLTLSMISMQKAETRSVETRQHLSALARRVQSLSGPRERLHLVEGTVKVALDHHLREVCGRQIALREHVPGGITFDWRLPEIAVPTGLARDLGVIASEFVSNSLEHAFPDGRGSILLQLEQVTPQRARLTLADDGIGLPEGASQSGLGLRLIAMLARHMDAELAWADGQGTRAMLAFRLPQ